MTAPRSVARRAAGAPRRSPSRLGLAALIAAVGAAAAAPLIGAGCSGGEDTHEFTGAPSGTGPGTPSGSGSGGSDGSGAGPIFNDAGIEGNVYVSPANPILKVELPLQAQTLPFQCRDAGTDQPIPGATWSISSLEVGDLSATGVFTPNGQRTGKTKITCKHGDSEAETELKVVIHALDNPGGLSPAQIDVLRGPPGLSDPQWRFMYPYDRTVFPRGTPAPEIQLTQGNVPGNGYHVHIVAPDYEYEGFFSSTPTATQLKMSQGAWEALTNAASGTKIEVHVSKIYNAQKYGPIYRTWQIASGKLHGTIYYNTYDSPLAGDGAIMRIKGSSPTPEVLVGGCTVCHSVAADGSTAAAANDSGGPGGIFDLSGGQLNPPLVWQDNGRAAFAAVFPKQGSVFVVNGAPSTSYPPNTPGTTSSWMSELRTRNGTLIPSSGIEAYYAMTPVFSHDGTRLAFTDRAGTSPYPSVLAMLDYDEATQKFSNYQVLATPEPGRHLSWPAFTPDGKHIVYQDGVGHDLATWNGNTGRLYAVDVQTRQTVYLGNLNGDGYMPAGARDENKNYEPTIAPIASGGYFWLMFTSRRTYGNKLTGNSDETKRLWVSALDLNAQDGEDFSHPAFYISGQELGSGNSRGFWALDQCKADGASCETGDECCNGFCNPTGDPPEFRCGPPDGSCSDEFESCSTKADCCDQELECINNKCAVLPPE